MAEEYEEDYNYTDSGSEAADEEVALCLLCTWLRLKVNASLYRFTCATVMTVDDLNREMKDIISEVSMILRIGQGHCRILLHKFNWNKESLLERFYENPDTDAFLRQAQVLPRKAAPLPQSSVGDCDICCMMAQLSGLDCYHWACSVCWEMYLKTKFFYGSEQLFLQIMNDNTSEIQCISNGCHLLIEDEKVMMYIKNEEVVSHSEPRPVMCSCGTRFCFGCANEWHEPVNCRLLKLWLKKCSDDSETSNWINANTKECPKCQVLLLFFVVGIMIKLNVLGYFNITLQLLIVCLVKRSNPLNVYIAVICNCQRQNGADAIAVNVLDRGENKI
uniref:RBR-type E3 ubiquitin transferase n=1 Tax=Heterorhabditis bacteriophora TaxID=37862 RepID=A0A1I7WVH2_HETBA